MLSLGCCVHFSVIVASRGFLLVLVHGFSLQWLLLLQSAGSRHMGSVVLAPRL